MSQSESTAVATTERRAASLAKAEMRNTITMQISSVGQAIEVADLMSRSLQGVPKEFRGEPGLCFAVVCQAMSWGMNPFSVAQQAYVVNDKVAYMAQAIRAVIDRHAPLDEPLEIEFTGDGNARQCVVTGRLVSNSGRVVERSYTSPEIGKIPTKNSPLWKSDPDQQLSYYSSRAWARRWCPSILLGVYDVDELSNESTAAPKRASMMERYNAAKPVQLEGRRAEDGGEPTQDVDATIDAFIARIAKAEELADVAEAFSALQETAEWAEADQAQQDRAREAQQARAREILKADDEAEEEAGDAGEVHEDEGQPQADLAFPGDEQPEREVV